MPTALIRVPEERLDQLKALAERKGKSVADFVGDLISAEIDRLNLAGTIGFSSVDVTKLENGDIMFNAQDIGHFEWNEATALGVADTLEEMSKGAEGPQRHLNVDAGLFLSRVGRSVRIDPVEGKGGRSFSFSLAGDLAKMIRSAVNEPL